MAEKISPAMMEKYHNWCTAHFPTPAPVTHTITKTIGVSPMTTFELVLAGIVVAYMVGRIGIPTLYSDISSVVTWVKSKFISTTTPVTPAV